MWSFLGKEMSRQILSVIYLNGVINDLAIKPAHTLKCFNHQKKGKQAKKIKEDINIRDDSMYLVIIWFISILTTK